MVDATSPLRVLFCHYTADVAGGSDRSLLDIVTHLPRDRFSPVVVLKKGDPLAARYREAGIPTHEILLVPPRRALEWPKLALFALCFLPSVLSIVRIILKERVHVVHVNTLFNLQGALAARLTLRPLVWHIRELMPGSRLAGLFLGCARRWAAQIIPNSHAVALSVADCGSRVHVIHNGIDLSEYDKPADGEAVRKELSVAPNAPVVTVIGRLEPWKGQHVLLEAFPQILQQHPGAQLWIVGGAAINKPGYMEQLKKRAQELGIAKNVCFTGIRDDIPAVLAATSVLVLPSVSPEPFGRTIIEAMAASRPVVATNHGGPMETVREGVTGLLVPADDAPTLAVAINSLLNDPQQAQQMGGKGREIAYKHFSLGRVVDEVGKVLQEAAK